MKKIILSTIVLTLCAHPADSLEEMFKEGVAHGDIRYYYIQTDKENLGKESSAHANSLGGTLSYTTAQYNGFKTGVTAMTTNGFLLPDSVDASIIGRDNGVRLENDPSGEIAQESFTVLGEAFIAYAYQDLDLQYGRKVIKTPLIDAKDVRMLPSAVQGAFGDYKASDTLKLGALYLTDFKQRTSKEFINIVEHALGAYTQAVTGHTKGNVVALDAQYQQEGVTASVYDYYAQDFLNSLYLEAGYKSTLNNDWSYGLSGQYIHQSSIGNAQNNLALAGSVTGGEEIGSNALGANFVAGHGESNFGLALTKVLEDYAKHDSLVLAWDGTPLYTNMITSNDLFQSNYGKSLTADSVYIGGTRGIRLVYAQGYDFTGYKGFKSELSYLNAANSQFANDQNDLNAVVSYAVGHFSLALKGIWVNNPVSQSASGLIAQDDSLTQYRVIANYTF